MRDIKFRGWSVNYDRWVHGYCLLSGKLAYIVDIDNQGYENRYQVYLDSVGQFTGVKDSNGAYVYEGDNVTWVDSDGVPRKDIVVWKKGGLVLCNDLYSVGHYIGKTLIVNGNTFENKELLNNEF